MVIPATPIVYAAKGQSESTSSAVATSDKTEPPSIPAVIARVVAAPTPLPTPSTPQPTPKPTPKPTPAVASLTHQEMLQEAGIPESDFDYANYIIVHESNYSIDAREPSTGACGIPQALPCSKMASAGSDYLTNPITQLKWMSGYVISRYGSWYNAYLFKRQHGWY